MSAEKLYSEIFEDFDNAKNKAERIAVLQKYDHARFREFLNYAFNPNIKFDVEIPNYRIAVEPAGLNYTYLSAEMPKMYRFIVGHPMRADGLSPTKQKPFVSHDGKRMIVELPISSTVIVKSVPRTPIVAVGVFICTFVGSVFAI